MLPVALELLTFPGENLCLVLALFSELSMLDLQSDPPLMSEPICEFWKLGAFEISCLFLVDPLFELL